MRGPTSLSSAMGVQTTAVSCLNTIGGSTGSLYVTNLTGKSGQGGFGAGWWRDTNALLTELSHCKFTTRSLMMSSSSRKISGNPLSSGLLHWQVPQCGQFLLWAIFTKDFAHNSLATCGVVCNSLFNLIPMRPYGAQLGSKNDQSLVMSG